MYLCLILLAVIAYINNLSACVWDVDTNTTSSDVLNLQTLFWVIILYKCIVLIFILSDISSALLA